jgi:hypothetical protein
LIFCWFFLPETKGVSLEDMDIMFSSSGFARQKRKNLDATLAERREEFATNRTAREKGAVEEVDRVSSV